MSKPGKLIDWRKTKFSGEIHNDCKECGYHYMLHGAHNDDCPLYEGDQGEEPKKELKKLDQDKVMLQLVPVSLVKGVGTILTFGAQKYAPRAWEKGFAWSRAFGALLRHLFDWWNGEDLDKETGKSHLWHAGCELAFLIEWETTHKELDDRPKKGGE